jgi:hypothetical protein
MRSMKATVGSPLGADRYLWRNLPHQMEQQTKKGPSWALACNDCRGLFEITILIFSLVYHCAGSNDLVQGWSGSHQNQLSTTAQVSGGITD